jgi:predicted PurR-regulated permease PerM
MGITFWLLGVPNAMLFTVLAFFLGFIPYLGTTIFTFGAAIIFVILGYYDKAVIVLLLQLLILNQLDLVFRPISMPKKVRIHPALMIIAVLAGIASFGMIGIIFGPTILVLFISSVEIYQQNYGAKSTISKSIDKQA